MQRKRKMFRAGCEPWVVQTCIRLLCHLSHHNLPFRKRNFQQVDFGNQNLFQTKKEPFLRKNVRKSNFFQIASEAKFKLIFFGADSLELSLLWKSKNDLFIEPFYSLGFQEKDPRLRNVSSRWFKQLCCVSIVNFNWVKLFSPTCADTTWSDQLIRKCLWPYC